MKQKKIFIIITLIAIGIMLVPSRNYAVLQANASTHGTKTDTPTSWMTNIRNMETANQAIGLSETIDATTKKSTSGSNNIDVHMIKSTEYGAVAILSASGYGNPNTIQSSEIKTTTGNKSGIYFNQAWENVAGGLSGYVFSGVDSKYYDAYTTSNTSAKIGDALGNSATTNPGCAGWHSATYARWVVSTSGPCFMRGGGSLFNFYDGYDSHTGFLSTAYTRVCRAAVVCGTGI